jgi:hypothetical protein
MTTRFTGANFVELYRSASQANDIDNIMESLSDDVEVASPIVGRMRFQGQRDVRILFSAVYSLATGLEWHRELVGEHTHVLIGEMHVGPFRLSDAMVLDIGEDGRICRVTPHLRPWLGLTVFAVCLGTRLITKPGMLWRAIVCRSTGLRDRSSSMSYRTSPSRSR